MAIIRLEITPNKNLKLILTPEGREWIQQEREGDPDKYISWENIFMEGGMDAPGCNGWDLLTPMDVGALTDEACPIVSNDTSRDDHGNYTHIGNVWSWIARYAVDDLATDLLTYGEVQFDLAAPV